MWSCAVHFEWEKVAQSVGQMYKIQIENRHSEVKFTKKDCLSLLTFGREAWNILDKPPANVRLFFSQKKKKCCIYYTYIYIHWLWHFWHSRKFQLKSIPADLWERVKARLVSGLLLFSWLKKCTFLQWVQINYILATLFWKFSKENKSCLPRVGVGRVLRSASKDWWSCFFWFFFRPSYFLSRQPQKN